MIPFNVMHTEDGPSYLTFVGQDGKPRTVSDQSPVYAEVKFALAGDSDPSDVYDQSLAPTIIQDDRVEYGPDGFSFEGEVIPEAIGDAILRYQEEGRDADNLIKFMERLSNNPGLRSRKMLFTWTQAKNIVIDPEGYIIGYKGVRADMLSCHSGTAEVDGVEMTGRIPNAVGTIISMPREKVQANPTVGCSLGLHVGNFSYARSFGAIVLEVRIDPADVVSVPKDCSFQKLRCCRYEVVAVHTSEKDDVAETYEPEATLTPEDIDAEMDAFMDAVPEGFLAALRTRMKARRARKNQDSEAEV